VSDEIFQSDVEDGDFGSRDVTPAGSASDMELWSDEEKVDDEIKGFKEAQKQPSTVQRDHNNGVLARRNPKDAGSPYATMQRPAEQGLKSLTQRDHDDRSLAWKNPHESPIPHRVTNEQWEEVRRSIQRAYYDGLFGRNNSKEAPPPYGVDQRVVEKNAMPMRRKSSGEREYDHSGVVMPKDLGKEIPDDVLRRQFTVQGQVEYGVPVSSGRKDVRGIQGAAENLRKPDWVIQTGDEDSDVQEVQSLPKLPQNSRKSAVSNGNGLFPSERPVFNQGFRDGIQHDRSSVLIPAANSPPLGWFPRVPGIPGNQDPHSQQLMQIIPNSNQSFSLSSPHRSSSLFPTHPSGTLHGIDRFLAGVDAMADSNSMSWSSITSSKPNPLTQVPSKGFPQHITPNRNPTKISANTTLTKPPKPVLKPASKILPNTAPAQTLETLPNSSAKQLRSPTIDPSSLDYSHLPFIPVPDDPIYMDLPSGNKSCVVCREEHIRGECPIRGVEPRRCPACGFCHTHSNSRTCPVLHRLDYVEAVKNRLKEAEDDVEVVKAAKNFISSVYGDLKLREKGGRNKGGKRVDEERRLS
jgi:Chromatin remodeling factor Mit1 C-terminal Zn finger 2